MSKHLPKTSKHLHDDDVKIWNSSGEDKDIKIWRNKSPMEYGDNPDPDNRYLHSETLHSGRRGISRAKYRHANALSWRRIAHIIIAAAILTAEMYVDIDGWLRIVSYAIPFLLVGVDVMLDALDKALGGDILNDCLIVSISSIASFAIGAYMEAGLIMILFRVSELASAFVEEKCRDNWQQLSDIKPKNANVETAEGVLSVGPEYVNEGDIIVVGPGERIALDGVITDGNTAVDNFALTGDSEPLAVTVGSRVFSGTVNLTSEIKVKVSTVSALSTVSRVLRIAESAKGRPSSHERFAVVFCKFFKPTVVVLAFALGIVPPLFFGQWGEWIRRAVILLLLSCSGEVLASVTAAYNGGIGKAVRHGMLFKGSDCLETFAKAETMVFDKTGTITEGRFSISEVVPVGMSEHKLLTIAATAESCSQHPIARSLREACGAVDVSDSRALEIQEIPGRGVCAVLGGMPVYVGNAALLEEHGIGYVVPQRSGAAIHVAVGNTYCGHILIQDKVREGAFNAMERLRIQGVKKMVMLTGDVLSVSRPIASKLNFDMLRAELTPGEKLAALDYLVVNRGEQSAIAFVGDGVSDSAVIERADVGICIGALGYNSAIQAADLVIMDNDVKKLPEALLLSKRTSLIALENIIGVLTVKFGFLLLGAAGISTVAVAAVCNAVVLVAAVVNAMRVLIDKKKD